MTVETQVTEHVAEEATCPGCGAPPRHKGAHTLLVRTAFGTLRLHSPRLYHCRRASCPPHPTQTFSPLAAVLPERSTPELRYLETEFAGLMSYGLTAKVLGEVLPLGRPLYASIVRNDLHAIATRLEEELGEERPMFVEGCQAEWDELPRPDLPLVVGLDGGYGHSSAQTSRKDGWFEVIAGKSLPTGSAAGTAKCFGFVQTYDRKPKRRLFEVLKSQGMQMNQQVTFLTDGGEDVRELPLYLNPQAEHVLDWFHLTMRLTVMGQHTKSLPAASAKPSVTATSGTTDFADDEDEPVRDIDEEPVFVVTRTEVARELERLKWLLWHGNVFRALQVIGDLEMELDVEHAGPAQHKLLKAVTEFGGYLRANGAWIPNYGERY